MSRIKVRVLSLYTKRLTRKPLTARSNVGFSQAKAVGILYHGDNAEKQEAVHQLANELKKLGKQVSILCCVTDPKQLANFTDPTVTIRDIPLFSKITHAKAKDFVNTSFDYLYQVDLKNHPVLDYLLARSKAKCRIGHYTSSRAGLFEIMISLTKQPGSGDITNLIAQMLHYTQLLKTT